MRRLPRGWVGSCLSSLGRHGFGGHLLVHRMDHWERRGGDDVARRCTLPHLRSDIKLASHFSREAKQ
jgi:hypothetical protein